MRLTVTPIGASGSSIGGVARAVVNYLEGERRPDASTGVLRSGQTFGVSSYYADSVEGPGRWLGAGAEHRDLSGVVDRDAFQRVLEGRHPLTGERLVTAQGSSQRTHLAVGSHSRLDSNGEPLYEARDAARLLGLRVSEATALIDAGRVNTAHDVDDAGWLGTVEAGPSAWLVPDAEISRHLELAARPPDAAAVRASGDPDDLLTVGEAARLLRVSPAYVRRLCANGEPPGKTGTSLASVRTGESGHFRVRRDVVADFAERRRPPVARVGFDLTLTVEKSVGLLAALTDGPRQEAIVRSLHAANSTAVAYMDRHASVARRRGDVVGSEGLLVASYFHGTSRALDPHPHHHNVVANAVVDDEGGVRTLDARALYRHAPAAAALATAALRWELRELGVGWRRRADGVWEIEGVSDDVVREFSRRRVEMDEVRRALEERLGRRISHHHEDTVALASRPDKQAVEPIALRNEWLTRADRVGLDLGSCFDRADGAIAHDMLPEHLEQQLFDDLVDPIDGLCSQTNTFDRGDVMRAITDWSIVNADGCRVKVLVPPAEVERMTARFCGCGLVTELDNAGGVIRRRDGSIVTDGQHEATFTALELLDVQSRILTAVETNVSTGAGVVDTAIIDDTIGSADRLSDEQADLVRAWLTSGDRVQCAIGRAGTGKTTTMRVAAHAWTAAGYRVLGAAVKGEAARQLAVDAGIESETVAMLLARSDAGSRVLDARTVLIVDEASTIGDRDLLRLIESAVERRATVRLIGDTAQHGSVPAGGSFTELTQRNAERTPELTTVRRLIDPGERHRAELIRNGKIDEAIEQLQASGQLVVTDSDHDTHGAMLTRWYTERDAGRSHRMVHGRNRERRVLNDLAQQILISDGIVEPSHSVPMSDGRRLCVGDQVVARHGDRRIHPPANRPGWMRNGTTGQITGTRPHPTDPRCDEIDVATDDGVITCDRATFDRVDGGIDLAYAVTSYAVQGATNDVSTSAIGASTSRSELYVDITRGRHNNQLYGTRPVTTDDDTEHHLPTLVDDLGPTLRRRLARTSGRTALGLDPSAPHAARLAHQRTLAGLVAAQQRGDDSADLAVAIRRAESAVRRIAENEPPKRMFEVMPACPPSPHLAARWRQALGDVAVYLAIENPKIRHDQAGLPGVIGSRHQAADPARWDAIAGSALDTAAEITIRQLLDHHDHEGADDVTKIVRQRPAWLNQHLRVLGENGALPTLDLDLDRLGALIRDVHEWRAERGLIDRTDPTAPLGPIPADPLGRAQRAQLQRRLSARTRHDPSRGIG